MKYYREQYNTSIMSRTWQASVEYAMLSTPCWVCYVECPVLGVQVSCGYEVVRYAKYWDVDIFRHYVLLYYVSYPDHIYDNMYWELRIVFYNKMKWNLWELRYCTIIMTCITPPWYYAHASMRCYYEYTVTIIRDNY